MPGDVHKGHFPCAGEREGSDAGLNGEATGLFLGFAVGVDAGEGAYQGGLAVVHMPGDADTAGSGASVMASAVRGQRSPYRHTLRDR
jgi:hypothetical protein